uniref:Uncharacterized protein n=1 Tax=Oryza punctata TaxID=4537 RepID=A0A0E0M6R7_ORYPU
MACWAKVPQRWTSPSRLSRLVVLWPKPLGTIAIVATNFVMSLLREHRYEHVANFPRYVKRPWPRDASHISTELRAFRLQYWGPDGRVIAWNRLCDTWQRVRRWSARSCKPPTRSQSHRMAMRGSWPGAPRVANWKRKHPGQALEDYDRYDTRRHEETAKSWRNFVMSEHQVAIAKCRYSLSCIPPPTLLGLSIILIVMTKLVRYVSVLGWNKDTLERTI